MRVLLDEMVPRKLVQEIPGHEVSTVPREGWASLKNGELLDKIDAQFDVFVTLDRNLRYQQNLHNRAFGVIEIQARSNSLVDLLPLIPNILICLTVIQRAELWRVSENDVTCESADGT